MPWVSRRRTEPFKPNSLSAAKTLVHTCSSSNVRRPFYPFCSFFTVCPLQSAPWKIMLRFLESLSVKLAQKPTEGTLQSTTAVSLLFSPALHNYHLLTLCMLLSQGPLSTTSGSRATNCLRASHRSPQMGPTRPHLMRS